MSRPPRTVDDLSSQSPPQGQGRPATAGDNPPTWCVLLPLPLGDGYDYRLPEGLVVAPGDFVVVPLGKREAIGVVWRPGGGQIAAERLKDIAARLDAPPLGEIQRRFIDWVAEYTVSPPGAVLRMAMSVSEALLPPRAQALYRLATLPPELKLTPARKRALDFARTAPAMPLNDLARAAGVGTGVIKGLAEAGAFEIVHRAVEPAIAQPDWREPGPELSPAQVLAADELRARAAAAAFSVTLLDGVPGAGKTEVYFEAIAAALQRGKQVLVLLPEIALSAQWLRRFAQRFGAAPAEWHSDLRGLARRRTWRAVAEGKARVVVGARSALFLPFADLGLIVVDEEHDQAFKQDDGTIYNARDMAVVRARLGSFAAILVSATPSLESVVNAESGRYRLVHLPDRHAGATLPKVELVDLRRDPPARGRFLSPKLAAAMAQTLAQGEQTLLFLNRRGYAPLTLCRGCGHRLQCPNCTAWLVEHRVQHRLLCHHCGHTAPVPPQCPHCSAEHSFVACGPGVERLAEEVSALHPTARVAVLTSDTLIGPLAAQAAIERITAGEVDIVIGTQIVAKGHHFPGLTLVGVVDGDIGLSGGDLRAAERTYQLLYQVAGRAGRADKPGRMLLQTHLPEHPVMQALADFDRDRFLAAEKAERAAAHLPPFGRLAALIVSGPDAGRVDAAARALAQAAPRFEDVQVLGPAPAPLALLRGRHRRRLLLKAEREVNVPAVVRSWVDAVKVPSNVRVQIDIDPYGFN